MLGVIEDGDNRTRKVVKGLSSLGGASRKSFGIGVPSPQLS